MKKLIRWISIVMAVAMLLTFAGCGGASSTTDDIIAQATTTAATGGSQTTAVGQTDMGAATTPGMIVTTQSTESTSKLLPTSGITTQVTTMTNNINITTTAKKTDKPVATKLPSTTKQNITSDDKLIALSFDDGPSSQTTNLMLDKLEKYDVAATFMLIGQNVHSGTKSVMERQLKLGCELGNHSFTHRRMGEMTATEIREEIQDTQNAIKQQVGIIPTLFRPPYIDVSQNMYDNIALTFICGIGADDWNAAVSAKERADRIINNVKDGDIILLHDFTGNNATAEALDTIIPTLKSQGYKFVTVGDLFKLKGVQRKRNTMYTNVK